MAVHKGCILVLVASSFVLCKSAFVETLPKCSIKDNECSKNFYQSLIEKLADDGAPDIGIEKIDPMELKDIHVSILDILNLTLTEGNVIGIKTCTIKSYKNDFENRNTKLHVFCKHLEVQGNYNVDLIGSVLNIQGLGGKNHGDGHAKVIIDKIDMQIDIPYHIEERDNDVFIKIENDFIYSLKVLGKASFVADKLIAGDRAASDNLIKYMNEHWKVILDTFGKVFFDKTMEHVQLFCMEFFDKVPTKYFITEDLAPYVK